MKIVTLSEQEAARTGYSHVAHFKASNSDLITSGTVIDVIALPIGSTVDKVAFHIVTPWNATSGTVQVGIAATATAGTTFLNTAFASTATAGTTLVASTTVATVNNTASRFLTAAAAVASGTTAAGEGYLYFNLVDHASIKQPLF